MKKTTSLLLFVLSFSLYSQPYTELLDTGLENIRFGSNATGDFNNDGYLDIIIAGINENSELSTNIYLNDKDGSFTKSGASLTPMYNSTIALGDYNDDGFLDILLAGEGYDPLAELWKNNGDLTFTKVDAGLAQLGGTNAELRDIDNDGDLDVLLSGTRREENGSYFSDLKLFSNEGNDIFEEIELPVAVYLMVGTLGDYDNDGDLDLLTGGINLELYPNKGDGTFSSPTSYAVFPNGEMEWLDFNNDGNLDFVVSGRGSGADDYFTKVYQNVGPDNNWFSESQISMSSEVVSRKLDFRDYNSDGFLDLLITGGLNFDGTAHLAKVYDNDGNTFTENPDINLTQMGNGDGCWFDMDNDGDLDLLLTGSIFDADFNLNFNKTILYRNDQNENAFVVNSPPSAPSGLTYSWSNDTTFLTWDAGSDIETPTLELSYNVGIGNDTEASNVIFPESNTDGSRLVQTLGNAQVNLEKVIVNLDDGIYYFKVQSIDGALMGSEFSEPERFAVGLPSAPSNASASIDANEEVIITWTDNSVNEFSFEVEQKSNLNPDYAEAGSVATDENSFSISGLEDGIYTFRIKAVNPNGSSEYFETNDIAVGSPSAPSNFSAVLSGDRDILLSWDDVVNERSYKLDRSSNDGESFEELSNPGMNEIEYLNEQLTPGTYIYRIQAVNENGESEFVNSDISIKIVLDVEDSYYTNLNVYPNPVINYFVFVEASDDFKIHDIQISDLTGKVLNFPITNFNNLLRIDFKNAQPGVYILRVIEDEEKIISRRIIIK